MKRVKHYLCLFIIAQLLLPAMFYGQEQTGTIIGTVTLTDGYPVPGVTVEASSPALKGKRTVVTAENGAFRLTALPHGTYEVTFILEGFKTVKRKAIHVDTGKTYKIDIIMETNAVKEEIVTLGQAPVVDVRKSAAAVGIKKEEFKKLPKGRDFKSIVTIEAGIGAESEFDNGDGQNYSFDPTTASENTYYVDGVDTTTLYEGTSGTRVNFDSIFEVKTKKKRKKNKKKSKKKKKSDPKPPAKPKAPKQPQADDQYNTEEYQHIAESGYKDTVKDPLSTFSIDVDTASYTNVRRFLKQGKLPPTGAVRIEEMINYFTYDYPQPKGKKPFSIVTEMAACPWEPSHRLIHIGLQGKRIDPEKRPPNNLVFLLDVSGSMSSDDKLGLLKQSLKLMVPQLDHRDRISIAVYAGAAGLVLPATPGNNKQLILQAIDRLEAGGSTAGGAGIKLAYKVALDNFIPKGNNRIILGTDGDFNVGTSSTSELVRMIEKKREKGVFITLLGFGHGNLKDSRMEQLADKGNGNYFYIDSLQEGKKVMVTDLLGTLFAIAKDVKLQVEFNPVKVKAYRLIGYENRRLANEDFADDKKDAGELGAGHSVTALYEIIGAHSQEEVPTAGPLKYQMTTLKPKAIASNEIMTVKLRYKHPKGKKSKLLAKTLPDMIAGMENTSNNFRFAAAVAQFGMLLRNSKHKGKSTYKGIIHLAQNAQGTDTFGYRAEFVKLVEMGSKIKRNK